ITLYKDVGNGYEDLGIAMYEASTHNWSYVWNTTEYDEITDVEVLASGRDAAGNEHRVSVLMIHIDNVRPVTDLVFPLENNTLDGYVHLKANCTDEHVIDAYFEWRQGEGAWNHISDANWNSSLSLWMYHWNTYLVGEKDDLEVRVTVVDDLGLKGYDSVTGVDIRDLAPAPTFLSPIEGDHLTGTCQLVVGSPNDTVRVVFSYFNGSGWVQIGPADKAGAEVWSLTWDTGTLSLFDTTIKAEAYDAVGNGTALLADIEIDNTSPAPFFLAPTTYQYHLFDTIPLVVNSDRDTVNVTFYYLDGEEWVQVYNAFYNPNTDRWEGVWFIPGDLYIKSSKLRAVAIDEVGLSGEAVLDHREIGNRPGDYPPEFLSTMPQVIHIDEDQEYMLDLFDHVDDNDMSTVKVYVTDEPEDLFYVDGENVTGELRLKFITLPDRHGEAVVAIHVVDETGQRDIAFLQVVVVSVPDPPHFTDVPPNLYVRPEVPYTFNFLPYVDDPDSPLEELAILKPDDEHVSKVPTNPLALEFRYSKDELDKSFFVNITLRDPDGHIAWISIMVWVVDDWVPELRTPLPDVWMEEDTNKIAAFNLDAFFYDKDQD
ncbi:MAG: hypothetical protein GWN18_03910, partial [Thermoplasmata archaeon]|nr:hypothetical protein [Thermoplasmata archaeon]NIS11174.1 hypothetical protein [Thermoplasmata archaeon]NIS19110.1 hypothetical protein [Thermoplasmata archaeon]NIT76170.1 hypothetical protein [Thermoplasmata archaeon]NIU48254.1 hypothetical protein [Thermoplasmata archaeon]